MATLTIPITLEQIRELARQLSPQERQALLDALLAERFDAVMAASDRSREGRPTPTDQQVQADVDAVRAQRRDAREDRRRAAGG